MMNTWGTVCTTYLRHRSLRRSLHHRSHRCRRRSHRQGHHRSLNQEAVQHHTALYRSTARLTTASSTGAAGVGEVNADATAVELLLVEAGDRVLGLVGRGVGDETETAGATSVAIAHHDRLQGTRQRSDGRSQEKHSNAKINFRARGARNTDIEDLAVLRESL